MSDVQPRAAGVRKHVEDEKLWLCRIETFFTRIGRVKRLPLLPNGLPFRFDLVEWIWFAPFAAHYIFNQEPRKPGKQTKTNSWIPGFQIHLNCDRAFVRNAQCE